MPRRRSTQRRRKQRGGTQYGYTGPAFEAAGGVPLESRVPYSHCGWEGRPAAPDVSAFQKVQFGGRRQRRQSRRRRQQSGGGCGCLAAPPMLGQSGGGSGAGGYSVMLSNELGKVYDSLQMHPCPPAPRENQIGGASPSAMQDFGIVSYKTGYGIGPESVVSTPSAHYVDPIGYDRTLACQTGGRRYRKKSRKQSRRKRQN